MPLISAGFSLVLKLHSGKHTSRVAAIQLGKGIQDLRPQANAGAEKKKAEKQAKADMSGSTS